MGAFGLGAVFSIGAGGRRVDGLGFDDQYLAGVAGGGGARCGIGDGVNLHRRKIAGTSRRYPSWRGVCGTRDVDFADDGGSVLAAIRHEFFQADTGVDGIALARDEYRCGGNLDADNVATKN